MPNPPSTNRHDQREVCPSVCRCSRQLLLPIPAASFLSFTGLVSCLEIGGSALPPQGRSLAETNAEAAVVCSACVASGLGMDPQSMQKGNNQPPRWRGGSVHGGVCSCVSQHAQELGSMASESPICFLPLPSPGAGRCGQALFIQPPRALLFIASCFTPGLPL